METHFLLTNPLSHFLIGFYFVFFGFWNIYHWRPIIKKMIEKNIPSSMMILAASIFCQTLLGSLLSLIFLLNFQRYF